MSGYSKNIAVIKGLKEGFSADGGPVSGLVKAEKYGRSLKVEVSLINFAPLSEGRFVTALSDGKVTLCVENNSFEGVSELDTGSGFAALVCYINDKIYPVASAICGNYRGEALGIKKELERIENEKTQSGRSGEAPSKKEEAVIYEDEAIAEDNYYEYENNESQSAVREDKTQKESGEKFRKDEAAFGAFEKVEGGLESESAAYSGGKLKNGLAGGDFYEKMRGEIENIFSKYPAETPLENLIEGSRWARISYGESGFYVFGVLYSEGRAEYICYGVPAHDDARPPESMRGLASFIPAPADGFAGFWVMYQDAGTGASLKIETE